MAQESCNLDKEEAEILKPSSPSSKLSPLHKEEPSDIIKSPMPSLFMNSPIQDFSAKKPEKLEKTIENSNQKASIQSINRCSSCKRKVGLTGFRCRCGHMFCGQHRYSDTHDCSFDYKSFGRQQIAKDNPLVRAAKIMKI